MKKQIKTNYKIGGIILLIMMLAIMVPTKSKANLQSRPGETSLTDKTASEFFLLCRQMETAEGPLGLSATISITEDNKVTETSGSNGIDVHMIKNTEYGAAAMLSASAYGDCPTGYQNLTIDSTTGNDSGIMQMAGGKYEYVAGINKNIRSDTTKGYNTYIINADAKYKDEYDSSSSDYKQAGSIYKPGDATYETPKWRGASVASFVDSSSFSVFLRSGNGMFNYNNYAGNSFSSYSSRAVAVCGTGI